MAARRKDRRAAPALPAILILLVPHACEIGRGTATPDAF